jgi:Trk K+ transport system NAD-binding subunit
LAKSGVAGAEYITPLVFMIVLGTVLLNATTARLFAKAVGVFLIKSEGILIVGASDLSRLIAEYLFKNNRHVVLIDSNESNIEKAKALGLEAFTENIYSDTLTDNIELNDVGYLMALTGNKDINNFVIEKFKKKFGENGSFRLISTEEKNNNDNNPTEGLFSHTDDYRKLNEVVSTFPEIHEITLDSKEHYENLIEITNNDKDMVPIFIKDKTGVLEIIPAFNKRINVDKDSKLVYLGKQIIR